MPKFKFVNYMFLIRSTKKQHFGIAIVTATGIAIGITIGWGGRWGVGAR